MPFSTNTSNPLPVVNNSRGLEELNKVTPFLQNLQQNWINLNAYYNRLAGGLGWNKDEIADKNILGRHLSPNFKRAVNPSTDLVFGATPVEIFNQAVTIGVSNADVKIKAQVGVETDRQGDNLFTLLIDRSPDGTTWTNVWEDIDTVYAVSGSYNFRWRKLSADAIDIVPTAGTWFYRVRVRHERNNIAIPVGLTATTVNLPNLNRTKMTIEWTNQRQP